MTVSALSIPWNPATPALTVTLLALPSMTDACSFTLPDDEAGSPAISLSQYCRAARGHFAACHGAAKSRHGLGAVV